MVCATGFFDDVTVSIQDLVVWSAAQLSVVQFYNPQFMRQYGVGVLNGSMWTIAVELQFYVLVPLLYMFLRSRLVSRTAWNCALALLAVTFLIVNRVYLAGAAQHSQQLWYKLIGVSFAPWIYMFIVGILFQRNFCFLHRRLAGHFVILMTVYCASAVIGGRIAGWSTGNALHPVLFVILSLAIFAAAFSCRKLSEKLLGRNDVSYGIYLYHMPVVNFLLTQRLSTGATSLFVIAVATAVLAYASWKLIEKPALGLKRHPSYQHASGIS